MKVRTKVVVPGGKKSTECVLIPIQDGKSGALLLLPSGKCSRERLKRIAAAARERGIILPREDEAST